MRSALGLGTVVVTCLATAGLAFLVSPGTDQAATAGATAQAGPTQAAEAFWDLAVEGDCRAASELMWWPADREARQRAYARICASAQAPDEVEVGEPRPGGSTETPYGATDLVVVPFELRRDGSEPVTDELRMVRVDGDWLVIR
ncbi:MAG: hypothetical protein JWN84_3887 [Nocardioides sp.]|jgi:hypothetical protein|nr:hypothetical protein [Nocardioides sp.]